MTEEEKQILDDLMYKGSTTKNIELYNGKLNVVIRNLSVQNKLDVEASMKDIKGVPAYMMHVYALKMLGHVVVKYGDNAMENPESTEKFLSSLPGATLDILVAKQAEFEKQIKALMNPESIEENFSETGSTETVST